MIQRIVAENFRAYGSLIVNALPGLNRVTGERGVGKTSLYDLLVAAFCWPSKGIGMERQIRTGTDGFSIQVTYIDKDKRKRKIDRTLTHIDREKESTVFLSGYESSKKEPGKDEVNLAIIQSLPCRLESFMACVSTRSIRDKERDETLDEFLGVMQPKGESIMVDAKMMPLIEKYLNVDSIERFGELAILETKARENRTVCGRVQKQAQPGPDPFPPTENGASTRPSKTAKEYVSDQQQWGVLQSKQAHRVGEISAQLEGYERAVVRCSKMRSEAAKEMKEPEPTDALEMEVQSATVAYSTAKAEYDAAIAEWNRLKTKKQAVDSDDASSKKTCDGCGRTMTPKCLKEYSERIGNDIAAVGLRGKGLAATRDETGNALKARRAALDEARSAWTTYRAWQGTRIAEPEPIDVAALTAEKAKAEAEQARCAKNVGRAVELATLARTAEAYDAKVKQFDRGRLELEEWDMLMQYLGKNGLRRELFAKWSPPFIASMNEVTQPLGLTCSIDEESGILMNGREIKQVCGGEGMLVDCGYKYAIALHSGLNLLCLDNSDPLTAQDQSKLLAILETIAAKGIQIIETETTSEIIPGTFRFELKDGVTVVTSPDGSDPKARPVAA